MKKKLTETDLVNWWLDKYHSTNSEKVIEDHPEWDVGGKNWSSITFYDAYPCTQEQHDEWYEWAVREFKKHFRLSSIKRAKRDFAFVYLNTAPKIIET